MEEMHTHDTQPSKKISPLLIVGGLAVVLLIGAAAAMATRRPEMGAQDSTMMETGSTSPESGMAVGSDEMMIQDGAMGSSMEEANAPMAETSEMMEGDVRVINVEGGSFYYKPNEIRVKKGEKVKIVFASKDMMHDLVVDELGWKIPVTKGGSTSEATFTADKAGTFEYYCSVGQHRAQGQVGKLIVE